MKKHNVILLMSTGIFAAFLAQTPVMAASDTLHSEPPAQQAQKAEAPGSKVNLYPIEQIPGSDTARIPVLDFKNTDIRDILRGIGMQYNINIFLEPDVTGSLSFYLTDIQVKRAIGFIIKRGNFAYTVENGIVKVYKYTQPLPPPPRKPRFTRMTASWTSTRKTLRCGTSLRSSSIPPV